MIAVDWGTSSFRAFRLGTDGAVLARIEAPMGILAVPAGGFEAALRGQIGGWLADDRRVLLSGMVGSRQGWVEAPYLPCPADAAAIAGAVVDVPFGGAAVKLVPGLCDDDGGTPEVMRGEETQIIGAAADGLVCLPGSHSKWVRVEGGRIAGFRTYLSGEAFAAIRAGTILGRMMPDAPPDDAAFDRGLERSGAAGHLLHHLFGVRTLGLMGRLAEAASASYLSGLLIGHELRAELAPGAAVQLIGSPGLCALYARAITALGGTPVTLDSNAAAAGLSRIGARIAWT